MAHAVRPIVARPAPPSEALAALSELDPLHARLFAMRGLTSAEELDYSLARLAPVGSLEYVDEAYRGD